MIKHIVNHIGKSEQRHYLKFILKISVVIAEYYRDSVNNAFIDLFYGNSPLFCGIIDENFIENKLTEIFYFIVVGVKQVENGNLFFSFVSFICF